MKVNNLVQLIEDYNTVFDILLDDSGISEVLTDIQYKYGESCVGEGDTFCVEENTYIKNGFGSLDKKTICFNFAVTALKYNYITDPDTGEECIDSVIEEVVEYLGYN